MKQTSRQWCLGRLGTAFKVGALHLLLRPNVVISYSLISIHWTVWWAFVHLRWRHYLPGREPFSLRTQPVAPNHARTTSARAAQPPHYGPERSGVYHSADTRWMTWAFLWVLCLLQSTAELHDFILCGSSFTFTFTSWLYLNWSNSVGVALEGISTGSGSEVSPETSTEASVQRKAETFQLLLFKLNGSIYKYCQQGEASCDRGGASLS